MKILIIAGEVSGDIHGSLLVTELKKNQPELRLYGIGGKRMQDAGVELLYDIKDMAVVGVFEVAEKILFLGRVYRKIVSEIEKREIAGIILIDYPAFNLRLAHIAKKNNIPVFYYISPQIWAWRMGRIKKIARRVDQMLVFFPFEKKIYEEAGMDVRFVGHPFLDIVKITQSKREILEKFRLDPAKKYIGLIPGSRKNEIDYLLGPMLKSAKILQGKFPETQFILLLSEVIEKGYVEQFIKEEGLLVNVISGHTYELMSITKFLIVASGSATLEAGLLGVPMIIVYKVNFFTFLMAKLLVKVKYIGLVNIVADKPVVVELLQEQVTPGEIVKYSVKMLEDKDYYAKIKKELLGLRMLLGETGAAHRSAAAILTKLGVTIH